jgi:hypothetical protein
VSTPDDPNATPIDIETLALRFELAQIAMSSLIARYDHMIRGLVEMATYVDRIASAVKAGGTAHESLLKAVEDALLRVAALEMRHAGRAGAA